MKGEITMVDRVKVADQLTKQEDISDYLDGCDVVTSVFKSEKKAIMPARWQDMTFENYT